MPTASSLRNDTPAQDSLFSLALACAMHSRTAATCTVYTEATRGNKGSAGYRSIRALGTNLGLCVQTHSMATQQPLRNKFGQHSSKCKRATKTVTQQPDQQKALYPDPIQTWLGWGQACCPAPATPGAMPSSTTPPLQPVPLPIERVSIPRPRGAAHGALVPALWGAANGCAGGWVLDAGIP